MTTRYSEGFSLVNWHKGNSMYGLPPICTIGVKAPVVRDKPKKAKPVKKNGKPKGTGK